MNTEHELLCVLTSVSLELLKKPAIEKQKK